jgi:hypothetical protein
VFLVERVELDEHPRDRSRAEISAGLTMEPVRLLQCADRLPRATSPSQGVPE